MGLYAKYVGPRFVSCLCSNADIAAEREKVVPHASGVVLEIGIGPGFNLGFYDPAKVEKVIGVDPHASFVALGEARRKASRVPVEMIAAPAEKLPLDDGTIDTAVVTYTLCSVDDPAAALAEIRRALKPEGRVLFLEHGLSHEDRVAVWQNRLNPLWKRLAVGCNLNRPVQAMLEDAGFAVTSIEHSYLRSAPRVIGYLSQGVARAA